MYYFIILILLSVCILFYYVHYARTDIHYVGYIGQDTSPHGPSTDAEQTSNEAHAHQAHQQT